MISEELEEAQAEYEQGKKEEQAKPSTETQFYIGTLLNLLDEFLQVPGRNSAGIYPYQDGFGSIS